MKNMLMKRLAADKRGQDLIEYALMAGFVAIAAGAIMPNGTVRIRIVCAVLAILFLGIIVLRRKKGVDE